MPQNEDEAIRYERRKLIVGTASMAITLIAALLFLFLEGTHALRDLAESWTFNTPAAITVYVLIVGAVMELLDLPLQYYSGYVLERQFNLSRLSRRDWALDWLKGLAVQAAFGLLAVQAIYAALRAFPDTWWIISAAGFVIFAVVLTGLAPLLLFRIFFKFEPLQDEELKERLLRLSEHLGVSVRGVYVWKLGDKTRRANAALAGWGRSRRMLLADNLISEHTQDEIEVVMAHELAHQVHGDIWRALAVRGALVFVSFYAVHLALTAWSEPLGIRGISDFANLPLLGLVTGAVTMLALPLANWHSRRAEKQADLYALEATGMSEEFMSAMSRLADQNLARRRPNPIVEFIFHSHPSVQRRIDFAREWQARAGHAA